MKENFPNLSKEIDFQEVQEAQRVPKKLDPRRNTPRHIIITLPKMKQKERILEEAREKNTVTLCGCQPAGSVVVAIFKYTRTTEIL